MMTNEETRIEEMENLESYPVETETLWLEPEEESENGSGLGKLVLAGLGIVGLGLAAFAYKKKDQIAAKKTEKAIKKLEKKGYTIMKVEDTEDEYFEESSEFSDDSK